ADLPMPAAPPKETMTSSLARAAPAVSPDLVPQGTGGTATAPIKTAKAAREALPLPPTPPAPQLGSPTDTVLPYTGLYVRPQPVLPPLNPRGRLAAFGSDRHADFNA